MRLWLSVLAVAVANWAMKAAGPVMLGSRTLPAVAQQVIALMAPVLLAGLIVVELLGAGWDALDGLQVTGVAVAGLVRLLRAPMLLAVLSGAAATALLRLL
jgi:branched-subunit amino acid transport protein